MIYSETLTGLAGYFSDTDTEHNMKKTYGIILILFSSLLFASYGVWAKLIGDGMDPFFQGWSRAVIISLALFPFLYYKKLIVPIKREHWKWFVVFLIFTAGTQAPLFYAFTPMDIGSATLLFFVSMLLTMYTVGFFFLGEQMSRVKLASFVLTCTGMYFIFSFSLCSFHAACSTYGNAQWSGKWRRDIVF